MTDTPARQPLWTYKREPAGMGEWCYRIYRNNYYMLYAESESIATIICNGLNRDEQAHHTSPPAPRPPCEECQYQARIDKAAKDAREKVLDEILSMTIGDQHEYLMREAEKRVKAREEPQP